MRRLLLLLLFLAAAPAAATITFNAGAPMTTNASFEGSKASTGGGVILLIGGTFDTATVALEVSSWSTGGVKVWIPADTCNAMTEAQVCRAAVGPVDLRLTVSSVGAGTSIKCFGFEVQAVVASSGGGSGATTFDLVGSGSNANVLDVTGSLAASGTGTITATAVPWAGISSSPFSYAAPDTIHTAVAAGGALAIRPFGGSGTTDIDIVPPTISYSTSKLVLGSQVQLWADASHRAILNVLSDFYTGFYASGWMLSGGNATATLPTINPNRSDDDTGIGHDATSGGVSIIDEATEVFRAVSTYGMTMGCKNFGPLSAAPAGAACDTYFDTDLAEWCYHTGAAWVEMDDSVTGCA